mgnify:CR=1
MEQSKLITNDEQAQVDEIVKLLDGLIKHEDGDKIKDVVPKIELLDSLVDRLKVIQSGKLTHGFCPCCGKSEEN